MFSVQAHLIVMVGSLFLRNGFRFVWPMRPQIYAQGE